MPIHRLLRRTTMLSGLVACAFLAGSTASAADIGASTKASDATSPPPAVAGLNGELDLYGGSLGNKTVYGALGSFAVPLQGPFGMQLDGNIANLDGDAFGAVAGHWFWRNPSQALLGIYASTTFWDRYGGLNVTNIGGETEIYLGQFTLQGIAGVEFGNSVSSTSTSVTMVGPTQITNTVIDSYSIATRFFDQVNLKYYFNHDFSAYVGHRYLGGEHALALGTEIARPLGGGMMASAFVEGRIGESDNRGVWGGLKVYFGPTEKPQMERHRRDDPNNWTTDGALSLFGNHAVTGTSNAVCTGRVVSGICQPIIPYD